MPIKYDQVKVFDFIRNLKKTGKTVPEITTALNAEGYRSPAGNKFTPTWLYANYKSRKRTASKTNNVSRTNVKNEVSGFKNLIVDVINERSLNDIQKITILRTIIGD